jgi:hypothetical protein
LAKASAKKQDGTPKPPYCKNCGKRGHRSDDCPNRREPVVVEEAEIENRTEAELHAAVQGLKDDGLNSLQVAAKLKITLREVNKFWD